MPLTSKVICWISLRKENSNLTTVIKFVVSEGHVEKDLEKITDSQDTKYAYKHRRPMCIITDVSSIAVAVLRQWKRTIKSIYRYGSYDEAIGRILLSSKFDGTRRYTRNDA